MPVGAPLLLLYAPDGSQTMLYPDSENGAYVATANAPTGGWQPGLYRVVLGLGNGAAMSATFTAGTDPALYVGPPSPSPTSVFNITGTNLPHGTTVNVHLFLTGGIQGEHIIPATTDANGAFSIYVWPQALGVPFFPAGSYLATLPDYGLTAPFTAREHPVSATMRTDSEIVSGQPIPLQFTLYATNRYLWGVYARDNGAAAGEFLAGPTDYAGTADLTLPLPALQSGTYYVATPYDWGETDFTVLDPPTATPTETLVPTPPATSTPKPRPTRTPTRVATRVPTKTPTRVVRPKPSCKKFSKKIRKKMRKAGRCKG
jgi:hypothetical protein